MENENNRKFERYHLNAGQAWFYIDESQTRYTITDISRGGLYFDADQEFTAGSRINISIDQMFYTEIEVVRVEAKASGGGYKVAAMFADGPVGTDLISEVLKFQTGMGAG
ncbi:MAG: PilZ domain-containing protein [Deltaproteobacteria bacterium]|nr:PilZ domain-containing protein [Deltaproteobacteria bacterium]